MNLKTLLKAFGINVKPEHIEAVEKLIPQLPAKVTELISWNVKAVKNFDERLARIEKLLEEKHGTGNTTEQPNTGSDGYGNRTIAAAGEHY